MKKILVLAAAAALFLTSCGTSQVEPIPLPEHPRPDFERADFINLNGYWKFTFDATIAEGEITQFDRKIMVPFPWGSKLSEVEDGGDVAWYGRKINVPSSWKGKRVFLVVGASDFETSAAIDGVELGSHRGGYTPFEFEITDAVCFGGENTVKLKVDDTSDNTHLYGKQGYGNARGIWQTVYLEARGEQYIKSVHFSPDIDASKVGVEVVLDGEAPAGTEVSIAFRQKEYETVTVPAEGSFVKFAIDMPGQHLWNLDDPYLYEVTASLSVDGVVKDAVDSYFGQRKISAMKVPGQEYQYVALNNEPLYLQLCLDQSYHSEGFYTFPSDEFMKNEIMLSKSLGLNGNRIHIKVEVPRKLYWADRLGLLIMADVPNFWGEPVPQARENWESCMRAQVERDYNHPSIFAWVDFNETWGLFTKVGDSKKYLPETQEWVRSMYLLTKSLDPTRMVEDNSACNNDHVQTDLNSWHSYRTGYDWEATVAEYDQKTVPGGSFNFIGENRQGNEPMFNSECGNVWGYKGSAGDCDYTWDYHEMMNSFHRHLKVGGWLYTEHHDVINEWNGYVRFDRSAKIDGLDWFVPGMSVRDFHTHYYIVPDKEVCVDAAAGSEISVKLMSSFTTSAAPEGDLFLKTFLFGWNEFGEKVEYDKVECTIPFKPFELAEVLSRDVKVPSSNGLYVLSYVVCNAAGDTLSRNFSLFRVKDAPAAENVISFSPAGFTAQSWSTKQLNVLGGLKVNGFGSGYFEYEVEIPENFGAGAAELVFEASAKQLLGKDIDDGEEIQGDFMLGKGTFDPCKNPNAYAMTDTRLWTSSVSVSVNGVSVGDFVLEDDPADHRGSLSWHSQPRDQHMFEAGSYGYLVRAAIPEGVLKAGEKAVIRFTVPETAVSATSGGLAIYGRDFGRYPMDPSIVRK